MIEQPLPCPFCGGNADTIDEQVPEGYYPWITFCRNCHITTPGCETLEKSQQLWNTRVEPKCEHKYKQSPFEDKLICMNCLEETK